MPPHTLESVNKVQYNKKESSLFISSRIQVYVTAKLTAVSNFPKNDMMIVTLNKNLCVSQTVTFLFPIHLYYCSWIGFICISSYVLCFFFNDMAVMEVFETSWDYLYTEKRRKRNENKDGNGSCLKILFILCCNKDVFVS